MTPAATSRATGGLSLDARTIAAGYRTGAFSVVDVVDEVLARIARAEDDAIWISRCTDRSIRARAEALARDDSARRLPLYGLPFAVKDNINVAGMTTTAA